MVRDVSGIYHRDVYLPEYIRDKVPKVFTWINYSDHARFKAKQRNIQLPTSLCNPNVIEVEYRKRLQGFVIRIWYSLKKDLCLAFSCSSTKMICVTCWMNDKDDQHTTLDVKRYIHG